jgi:hypothetical protein
MGAYSGSCSIEGNKITHKIEVPWNQVCGFSDAMLMVRSALFFNCHMNGVWVFVARTVGVNMCVSSYIPRWR